MEDINNMSIEEFNNLMRYLERRERIRKNQIVPLRDKNKEMIKRAKEVKKDGK